MTADRDLEGQDTRRKYCGAKTRGGGTCKRPAGWGTGLLGYGPCKLHGGATRNHKIAARKAAASDAVRIYGLPVETTPEQALLDEVRRTAGHVEWLRLQIDALNPDALVRGITSVKTTTFDGEDGPAESKTVEVKAAINQWLALYQQERAHLVRVASEAIRCGVAQRQVEIAEETARQIAEAMRAVVIGLGHDPTDPKVKPILREALEQGRVIGVG